MSLLFHLLECCRISQKVGKPPGFNGAVFFAYYNFCRPHQTLTENAGRKTTPAMAAGLEDHPWTLRNLIEKSTH